MRRGNCVSALLALGMAISQVSAAGPAATGAARSAPGAAAPERFPALQSTPISAAAPETEPAIQPAAPAAVGANAGEHPGAPGAPPGLPSLADFAVHSGEVTDEQVLHAINKGVDYLLLRRHGGNFENGSYAGGGAANVGAETAMVVYTLLHVSEGATDEALRKKTNFASPELAPVISYLKGVQPDGTYLAAFLCCSLTLMPKTPDIVAALERPKGPRAYILAATKDIGGYQYTIPGSTLDAKIAADEKALADLRSKQAEPGKKDPTEVKALLDQIKMAVTELGKEREASQKQKANLKNWNPDGSNTQYGVLGAWALADYGIEIPPHYWAAQDRYWRLEETPEGAFPYNKDYKTIRDTMAAAGLATMFVTEEFLDLEPRLEPKPDKQIDAAIQYVSEDFDGTSNDLYYDYAVERAGLASGLKFLGAHDWYREFAQTLVKTQHEDGSWTAGFYHGTQADGVSIATCYALLTLARGRNPVFINKLEYAGPWNARSRDAARLTERMGKSFERPLNWQVVSEQIPADNWMDAPLLLITGSVDPKFSPATIAKLKAYTEMGGLIFSTADGDKPEFTEAMKKYAAEILPGRQMRELPADHPILNGDLWVPVANPPKLYGLSNGIREVWIHSPTDMGASWTTKDYTAKANWDIPGNIYFYATGKSNLRSRLQSPVVMEPATPPGGPALLVGRLLLGDNADPEPAAWPRMVRLMRAVCQTNVHLTTVSLGDLAKSKDPPAVLQLTGTTALDVSDAQVAELRSYLDKGGLLIADSAGMSPAFSDSFKQLCKRIYPKSALGYLPANAPVYTGTYANAKPIVSVRYRPFYAVKHQGLIVPQLQAVQPAAGERYTILFSEQDITSGLLGTNTWGINGYSPESAQALARNMLLYALNTAPPKKNKSQKE
jgi:hypothetical protein